jgi:hypothetical protein
MTTPFPFVAGATLAAADLNSLGTWDTTSWTTTVSNITVGNGTETALFTRIGNGAGVGLVAYYYKLDFGSTTAITGTPLLNYPVEASDARQGSTASWAFYENDNGTDYYGRLFRNNSTRGTLRVFDSSGTYVDATNITSTVPFTWTTSDRIIVAGYYRPGV